jgi:hypothetical protein
LHSGKPETPFAQGRTGHSSNATLVAEAMRHWWQRPLQSPLKNVKKGLFRGILGAFEFFCTDGRRGLLMSDIF